jgi:flagellar biogenesis protein FliO
VKSLRAVLLSALLLLALVAHAQQPPQSQTIPYKKEEGAGALALNVGLGFLVAIGLGLGALYLLRNQLQRRQGGSQRRLRVVETLRLAPRTTLFLVEFDGRGLLLGQHGENIALIKETAAEPPGETRAE